MKGRFDGLDVQAMVALLQRTILGRRVVNIYDGENSNESFVFKLEGDTSSTNTGTSNNNNNNNNNNTIIANPAFDEATNTTNTKEYLLIESGIRFHTTSYNTNFHNTMPSPFTAKLRKHIRSLRIEKVYQIGTDRVVIFQFGVGAAKHSIIIELYAKGNILLVNKDYTIISLLRSHIYNTTTTTPTTDNKSNNNSKQQLSEKESSNNKKSDKIQGKGAAAAVVQVGQVYPVIYATSMTKTIDTNATIGSTTSSDDTTTNDTTTTNDHTIPLSILEMKSSDQLANWIKNQLPPSVNNETSTTASTTKGSSKKKDNTSIKNILLRTESGISHYGPALIEHCLLYANIQPNLLAAKLLSSSSQESSDPDSDLLLNTLLHSLQNEGRAVINALKEASQKETPGYILYRIQKQEDNNKKKIKHGDTTKADDDDDEKTADGTTKDIELYDEFVPHLLKQHENKLYKVYSTFGVAVDEFFNALAAQKAIVRATTAEQAAAIKLQKIRQDQMDRIHQLEIEQDVFYDQARTVQLYADSVNKALLVINSALNSGIDWDQIDQIVTIEKEQNKNPIALLIHSLELQDDRMILRFPRHDTLIGNDPNKSTTTTIENDEDNDDIAETTIDVPVVLAETAHANANRLFAKYRAAKEKTQKTMEASSKAFKAAEEAAKRQVAESNKRKAGAVTAGAGSMAITKRIYHWYEKFHWFITSDNYLVIGGRDAQQNELLVKRYLRPGDVYLHADIFGAASCILRAKRRRIPVQPSSKTKGSTNSDTATKTEIVPLSDNALREAGNFCICHSSAWKSKIITSAYWVEAHQVSKTAPTGEYLTTGAFMIRGKKNYLPPSSLEMGFAVLFRYSDDDPDAVQRHKNERRDFALLNNDDNIDDAFLNDKANDDRNTNNVNGRNNDEVSQSNVTSKLDNEEDVDENEENVQSANLPDHSQEETETKTEANNTPVPPVSDEVLQHVVISDDDDNDDVDNNDNDKELDNDQSETDDSDDDENKDEVINDDGVEKDNNEDDSKTAIQGSSMNKNGDDAPKKRGLSARDRKLIKRYGSLEEAQRVLGQTSNNESNGEEIVKKPPNTTKEDKNTKTAEANKPKRGKKGKEKRVMKKYADQDEADRKLALLALQGGEQPKSTKKKGSANNKKGKSGALTSVKQQEELAAETAKLLIKDSSVVALKLSQNVRDVLVECITVRGDAGNNTTDPLSVSNENIRWDKLDGDTLEQLLTLEPPEAQLAAAKRLLVLKQSTRVDNFSSSLGGIIRTIRKYGYETFDKETVATNEVSGKRKTKGVKESETIESKNKALEPKAGVDDEDDESAVDDTIEISKLTGKPHPDDLLLYCVPVCGPYASLQQYTYRVKLTPGNMKRGKAVKQCLELFLKTDVKLKVPLSASQEKQLELIKRVPDTDWVQAICADTKISSAGASKVAKGTNPKSKGPKK